MRFLRFTRAVLVAGLLAQAAFSGSLDQPNGAAKKVNELSLAGLRPGKDTLARAEKLYSRKGRVKDPLAKERPMWMDVCTGYEMSLELDSWSVIESVTISRLGFQGRTRADCTGDPLQASGWKTGRGLRLGDSREKVRKVYGTPDSQGPSTERDRELELMFYQFDWAGPDVPQVMEVTLERGRVVKITLAFPSL